MIRILGMYKSKGPTSHDVINEIRKITGIKKVGHAGTLDPLASGVLVVGIGRDATKKLGDIVKKEKEYIATIRLGETSTTDDMEGEKTINVFNQKPTKKEIVKILPKFIGSVMQVPPKYSAVKLKGKRAYKLAREGREMMLEPRNVFIKNIGIEKYNWPILILSVETGSGVYIRSLARDIGKKLKTGAYLKDLERIRVGDYTKEKSLTLDEFENTYEK